MTEVISSPQNQLIKQAAALKHKKFREELGLFVVEGVRLCEDFAASDWQGQVCLFTEDAAQDSRVEALLKALAAKNCRMASTTSAIYAKISDTEQPQGVMVMAAKRRFSFADMLPTHRLPLIVVLDGVQDPGNVGAVIRTADAAGASGVILTQGSADLFAGKTVRSTMGSLFHLPVLDGVSRDDLMTILDNASIPLAATAMEAADVYHNVDMKGALAIAFGNEGQGMSDQLLAAARWRISIPIYGKAESLNVATASAVVLYEAARQRQASL